MGNLNFLQFNASEVEPNSGFDPIPEGKYTAVISESEMRDTRAGTGRFLALTFQIIDGDYKGRNLWTNLNIENPNPKAVQIALGELSSICRAVGVPTPRDSSELHDIPLTVSVKLVRRSDNGELKNEIKGYFALSGATQQHAGNNGSGPHVMAHAAAAPAGRAPWNRK